MLHFRETNRRRGDAEQFLDKIEMHSRVHLRPLRQGAKNFQPALYEPDTAYQGRGANRAEQPHKQTRDYREIDMRVPNSSKQCSLVRRAAGRCSTKA